MTRAGNIYATACAKAISQIEVALTMFDRSASLRGVGVDGVEHAPTSAMTMPSRQAASA